MTRRRPKPVNAPATPSTADDGYEVHYHPPDYPERCFPSRCSHPGTLTICSHVELVPTRRGGRRIEMDHIVCLGCGASRGGTYGGNVLVDVAMCLATEGPKHYKFALRLQAIRDKWARLATYLFDEQGWNGRHERIARLIDPKLTMKLFIDGRVGETAIRMGRISFDPSYLRPA